MTASSCVDYTRKLKVHAHDIVAVLRDCNIPVTIFERHSELTAYICVCVCGSWGPGVTGLVKLYRRVHYLDRTAWKCSLHSELAYDRTAHLSAVYYCQGVVHD